MASFEAKDFPSGRLTAANPGMAVRVAITDEILEDGLDLAYEVVGGSPEARGALLEDLEATYRAELKVTQDRPEVLRFLACLKDWGPLKAHPVTRLELDARMEIDRVAIVYEAGLCVMRVELRPGSRREHIQEMRDRLATACREAGIDALVRLATKDRSMEDWEPLPAGSEAGDS